jgi:hypothetical protein
MSPSDRSKSPGGCVDSPRMVMVAVGPMNMKVSVALRICGQRLDPDTEMDAQSGE